MFQSRKAEEERGRRGTPLLSFPLPLFLAKFSSLTVSLSQKSFLLILLPPQRERERGGSCLSSEETFFPPPSSAVGEGQVRLIWESVAASRPFVPGDPACVCPSFPRADPGWDKERRKGGLPFLSTLLPSSPGREEKKGEVELRSPAHGRERNSFSTWPKPPSLPLPLPRSRSSSQRSACEGSGPGSKGGGSLDFLWKKRKEGYFIISRPLSSSSALPRHCPLSPICR